MAISSSDYNRAVAILVQAGSKTAAKAHPMHGSDSCPDDHGKQLLQEARDEFRITDKGLPALKSEMTQSHYNAVQKAANQMGITNW